MKTKHVKNTGTNGQEGANWKITRGAKGENCQGGKEGKKLHKGALPLFPVAIVGP